MAKKIGIIILSAAIIVIGVVAFNRLHYWERSVRIFTTNEQTFKGDFDRRRSGFEGNRTERITRENLPDNLIQQKAETFRRGRDSFRQRNFEGDRNGRRDYRRGSNVQLRNVGWFLAVFALFTTGTIYIDRLVRTFIKKKK